MSNLNRKPTDLDPHGAEGVPVDAPGNDAPAISPQAVSRMHRAEDDDIAFKNSPEYTDHPTRTNDQPQQETRRRDSSTGGPRDDANRGLDADDPKRGVDNPSHGTSKDASTTPKGAGDGELRQQPKSTTEARQRGADNPKFDE